VDDWFPPLWGSGPSIRYVHLRRALLLFAIVLGLAAIAASLSRPPEESGERAERAAPPPTEREETPTVSPGTVTTSGPAVELVFAADREQVRRLDVGQPATVLVEVDEPGLVEIPQLGLSAPAEPLTPARFDVRITDPERVMIVFTAVADDSPRPAGVLAVEG
jgi:hypothetical protein